MATETLRPNATGDEESITSATSGAGLHWQDVDEEVADDGTTKVYLASTTYLRDLYNLPAHSVGSGTVNFIKIYFRAAGHTTGYAKPSLKSDTTVTDGTEVGMPASDDYTTFSQQWNTNPADSAAWEWADIDALQIGVSLKNSAAGYTLCTQVYVEVDYTVGVVGRSFGYIIG